jgi:hypothetical protein
MSYASNLSSLMKQTISFYQYGARVSDDYQGSIPGTPILVCTQKGSLQELPNKRDPYSIVGGSEQQRPEKVLFTAWNAKVMTAHYFVVDGRAWRPIKPFSDYDVSGQLELLEVEVTSYRPSEGV